jgi:hypothetical protein
MIEYQEVTMSDAISLEIQDSPQEMLVKVLLDEEFKSVFGGITPVNTAWTGLGFI